VGAVSAKNASDILAEAKQCDDAMFTKLSEQVKFGIGFFQLKCLQACHWKPFD
jgi:hypothetical protein